MKHENTIIKAFPGMGLFNVRFMYAGLVRYVKLYVQKIQKYSTFGCFLHGKLHNIDMKKNLKIVFFLIWVSKFGCKERENL